MEDYKYEYAFIDAQWCIMRAKSSAAWGGGAVNPNLLAKSFIQSIMKFKRDFSFRVPILCWDKSPYIKSKAIAEYKQDRYRPSVSEIDELREKLKDPTLTPEQQNEINERIKQIELDIYNFQMMQKVKYYVIFNLGNCGMDSIIKSGYEADDLAYMLSQWYLEHPVGDKKSLLLTIDRDWVYFQNEKVDFISAKYLKTYPELTDPGYAMKEKYGISLYHYGVLSEIYGGSHNNVEGLGEIEFEEFIRRYYVEHDTTMPRYNDVDAYFNAMNMDPHRPDLDKQINYITHNNIVEAGKMHQFCSNNMINLNMSNYDKLIDGREIVYNANFSVPPLNDWTESSKTE